MTVSLAPSYFEQMYADSADPWSLASRWYEQRKYALTVASLRRERYRRGFEPGCSIGVLSKALAARCDELIATDVVPQAVEIAGRRVAASPHVHVRELAVPRQWPDGRFDLLVISELGYYLSHSELGGLVERAASSLEPDGDLVVVHWRHEVPDYPLTGDDVHAAFRSAGGLQLVAAHEETDFRLDVFAPLGAPSVAEREGLV
ncbi:MAG TPA: SAM-dependent methyltransferase [Mycobacteriales bacterium]|nr:SAM-dependent methyltransferase [Mycobacteriales bacterium]